MPRKGKGDKSHLRDEYKSSGPAPFSLYTETMSAPWTAPLLTLPGKVPHRLASGVVRR